MVSYKLLYYYGYGSVYLSRKTFGYSTNSLPNVVDAIEDPLFIKRFDTSNTSKDAIIYYKKRK